MNANLEFGARVVYLRAPDRPGAAERNLDAAGLELLDVILPDELEEDAASVFARTLAASGKAFVLDLPPKRIAKTSELGLPCVRPQHATVIHNLAKTLAHCSARELDFATAKVAVGGRLATLVADSLAELGLAPERVIKLENLKGGAPEGVDLFLLPEPDRARLAEKVEPEASETWVGLELEGSAGVLPGLVRAAVDTQRPLAPSKRLEVAQALAGLAQRGELPASDDQRVLTTVAAAVAHAVRTTASPEGQAEKPMADGPWTEEEAYREALAQLASPVRSVLADAVARARKSSRRLVFLDGEQPEVLLAARELLENGLAEPLLLGDLFRLENAAKELGISLRGMKLHNPARDRLRAPYAEALHRCLGAQLGLDLDEAKRLVEAPAVFGALTVARGEAHGIVSLLRRDRELEPIQTALDILPLREGVRSRVGLHLVAWRGDEGAVPLVIADTLGERELNVEELAEAALHGAAFARASLGLEPRVALIAETTFGARRHPALERLERACELARVRSEGLLIDGPLAADVALDAELQAERYPACALEGAANVLVFPTRAAARAAVDLLAQTARGAEALGPLIWGLRHPLGVAERGVTPLALAHLGLVTSALAIQAGKEHRESEDSELRTALEEAVEALHAEEAAEPARA